MYHNLSVSGGAEKVRYYFSLGYTGQEGIWVSKDQDYKKYNVRSNISAELTKGLTVDLQISGRLDTRNQPYNQDTFKAIYKAVPTLPVYANNTEPYWQDTGDNANPAQITRADEVGYDRRDRREFTGSLIMNWELPWVKGLTARALWAYDYNNLTEKKWLKEYYEYQYDPITDVYNKSTRRSVSELNQKTENAFTPTQ